MSVSVTEQDPLARAEACCQGGDLGQGLAAAEQALAEAVEPRDRARAAWLSAYFQLRLGDYTRLLAQADARGPLIRSCGGRDRFDYVRSVALAGCELGRFDVAMAHATELGALAHADGAPTLQAYALMALASCFERMGDPWQAERLMHEALALMRAHGGPRDRFVTLNNLSATLIGAYYLLRGDAAETDDAAVGALTRALPLAREMQAMHDLLHDPYLRVVANGNLGEILLHLGQVDEARQLLQAALIDAQTHDLRTQAQRVRCSLAEWALQHGQTDQALDIATQLLAEHALMPLMPLTELRAHHAAYKAARQRGDTARALTHLERRTELERVRAVRQFRAQSEQFITRVEAEQARREAERQRAHARAMEADARQDPLTGLGNRRDIARRLPALLADAERAGHPLAVVMLDLDHFKSVNDRFGHPVGDEALVAVAQMLRDQLRANDLIARTGGEEFLAVLPDAPPGRVHTAIERIRSQIAGHDWTALAPGLSLTISAGIAAAPPYDETKLIARADAALYRAKLGGRNRIETG
jgi:diguanylate cyclase (GGDEF)-like protein